MPGLGIEPGVEIDAQGFAPCALARALPARVPAARVRALEQPLEDAARILRIDGFAAAPLTTEPWESEGAGIGLDAEVDTGEEDSGNEATKPESTATDGAKVGSEEAPPAAND